MNQDSSEPGRVTPEYDPTRRVYTVDYHETGDAELSVTVVQAVMDVTGRDPTEVNLNDAVHPDALNSIFADRHDGVPRTGGSLTFSLAGCEVTVLGNGEVVIDPTPTDEFSEYR